MLFYEGSPKITDFAPLPPYPIRFVPTLNKETLSFKTSRNIHDILIGSTFHIYK